MRVLDRSSACTYATPGMRDTKIGSISVSTSDSTFSREGHPALDDRHTAATAFAAMLAFQILLL